MEEWRVIEKHMNYEISNQGRVRHIKKQNILAQHLYQGYYKVKLCQDGKDRTWYVHRLVAETFIPNPDNKPTIDHINRNRNDNRVENLRWATRYEQSINKNHSSNFHHIHKQKNNTYQVRIDRTFKTLEEAIAFRDSFITEV